MEQKSSWGILRKRNIFGAVLAAGLVAGVYLGNMWKGFGGGSSVGIGISEPANSPKATEATSPNNEASIEDIASSTTAQNPEVVKVLIDNRMYLLRTVEGEKPIELSGIVKLALSAKGDEDGVRIRIYRKLSSRVQAEEDLKNALTEAGIQEKEQAFIPTPVDAP